MKNQIILKIITPQGIIINRFIDIITVKTIAGYMGILYGHIPIVSIIVASEILYKINNKEYKLNVSGGILKVEKKIVKILVDEIEIIS